MESNQVGRAALWIRDSWGTTLRSVKCPQNMLTVSHCKVPADSVVDFDSGTSPGSKVHVSSLSLQTEISARRFVIVNEVKGSTGSILTSPSIMIHIHVSGPKQLRKA